MGACAANALRSRASYAAAWRGGTSGSARLVALSTAASTLGGGAKQPRGTRRTSRSS